MKKKVLFVAALFTATFGMAQDLTSKKGETILPEAGDYAIGFDASPFVSYFGNLFNSGTNAPFSADFTNSNNAIYGKMFTDANNAYRLGLRLGTGSSKATTFVDDLSTNADPGDMVEDEAKNSNFNLVLSVGKEMRRGNTRLQGLYGVEGMIAVGTSKSENSYGNDIEREAVGTKRALDSKAGTTFGLGLRAFVGVEYFVAAKISIAAEYGWGLMVSTTGAGETNYEENLAGSGEESTVETGKSSSFGLDTDVSGASLKVMFHF